jgi:hypothetical protein
LPGLCVYEDLAGKVTESHSRHKIYPYPGGGL